MDIYSKDFEILLGERGSSTGAYSIISEERRVPKFDNAESRKAKSIVFYHLTVTHLLKGLPKLVSKIFEAGQRVFILCKDTKQMAELDLLLWTFSQKEFIPHDTIDGLSPELQPILLGTGLVAINKADVAIILNGLQVGQQLSFNKYVYVFYGNSDEDDVRSMLQMYEDYKNRGLHPVFWEQHADGKWVQTKDIISL